MPTTLYSREPSGRSIPLAHPDILVTTKDKASGEEMIASIVEIYRFDYNPTVYLGSLFQAMLSSYALRPTEDGDRCVYLSENTDYIYVVLSTEASLYAEACDYWYNRFINLGEVGRGKYIQFFGVIGGNNMDFQGDEGQQLYERVQHYVNMVSRGPMTIDDQIELFASYPGAKVSKTLFDQDGQVTEDTDKMVRGVLSVYADDCLLYETWFEKSHDK